MDESIAGETMPINETTLQNEEREEEEENRTEMDVEATPSKGGKSKKRAATYPEEVLTNDCYSLFLSIYRDRHSVDSLIADVVKDLKVLFFHFSSLLQKAKSASEIKLFALILYLSDLKLNPSVYSAPSLASLALSDLILDSQDVLFPSLLLSRTTSIPSPPSPSVLPPRSPIPSLSDETPPSGKASDAISSISARKPASASSSFF